MRFSTIDSIGENNGSFFMNKLKDNADFFTDCCCLDDKILPFKKHTARELDNLFRNARKIYSVNDEFYILADNGYLYKAGDSPVKVSGKKYTAPPVVTKAPFNYGKSVFIIDGEDSLLRGEVNGNVFLPKGKGYYVYQDYVFVYSGNSLFYGTYCQNDSMFSGDFYGRIDIDSLYGDILGLAVINSVLTIVSTYGVSVLSILESKKDYQIKKTIALPLAVRENSVKCVGNDLFFISGKKLYRYGGNKLETIDFFLEDKNYTLFESYVYEDKYLLNVELDGEKYLYYLSVSTGEEGIMNSEDLIFCDNGYCFDVVKHELSSLFDGDLLTFVWKSRPLDLGRKGDKVLYQLSIRGKGEFKVEIESGYKTTELIAVANKPIRGLNLCSEKFVISATSRLSDSYIEEMEFKYRFKEEK